jgi:hypothetical protein
MLQKYGLLPLVGYTGKAVCKRKNKSDIYGLRFFTVRFMVKKMAAGLPAKKSKNNGYFFTVYTMCVM